jgi:hypothetical protein
MNAGRLTAAAAFATLRDATVAAALRGGRRHAMPLPMPVIVGVPRSGTTLLRMMIDAHPEVAIPPETGFLPALAALDPAGDSAGAAWRIITGFHTWPDFHLDAAALRETFARLAPLAPAEAARAFYRAYAARHGKARWGDKTPGYSASIDRIASLLPEARVIHVIRDGRDVMVSVRPLWFRPGDTAEACAADWAQRIVRTRQLGATLPWYLEVRYEALVMRPEDTLRTICAFLELAYEPAMLSYYAGSAERLDEHEARYDDDGRLIIAKADRLHNQRLVTEPPRADRIGRWRTELTADEARRFAAVAGEWLDRLGYGPSRGRGTLGFLS